MSFKSPLTDMLDKKVLVLLRDGRKLVGMLRSYDQYSNLILMDSNERIYAENKYADIPRGVFVVRGENLVFIGLFDRKKDKESEKQLTDIDEILIAQSNEMPKKERLTLIKEQLLRDKGYGFEMEHEIY